MQKTRHKRYVNLDLTELDAVRSLEGRIEFSEAQEAILRVQVGRIGRRNAVISFIIAIQL